MRYNCFMKNRTGCFGKSFMLFALLFVLLFSGCAQEAEPEPQFITVEFPEGAIKLFYPNEERTKVNGENFDLTPGTLDAMVSEMLTALEEALWTEEEKDLISDRNPIVEYKIDETGLLSLRFATAYPFTNSITEVLRRGALVKTFCQLDGVTAVEFYVGTQPMLTSGGKPVGMLTAEDFIDSTGENTEYYQEAKLSVYFANEKGDALVESNLKITYDGTMSTERLILTQLMGGPVLADMQPVIPQGTVLNKVTTRDGVCFVDFNDKFMEKRTGISAEVAIYSVVNSLTELSNVYKVQFLINGETKKTYQNLDFSQPFERNLEIVEGEQ